MTQSSVNFGSCWSCTDTLTDPAIMVTGFRVVAEAVIRRWGTPRGSLIDDPNFGYDLSDWIGADFSAGDLARLSHEAGAEAEKDERVLSCDVSVTLLTNGELNIVGKITTAQGPFTLVASVSQVTVALLQVAA